MQQITIPVTDKQHSFLSRVAKENRRTLSQVIYLMIETGHCLGYECMSMNVDKTDDEISQEDKDQIALNKQIKKDHPELYAKYLIGGVSNELRTNYNRDNRIRSCSF